MIFNIPKIKVTVNYNNNINPQALIEFNSGFKFLDNIIKPKIFFIDVDKTRGKWHTILSNGNLLRLQNEIDSEFLFDLIFNAEEKNTIDYNEIKI